MHRSLLSMKDLPLTSARGVRVGDVVDGYYEPYEQRILGFTVAWEDGALVGADDIIPITAIVELTADTGTVYDELGLAVGLELINPDDRDGLIPVSQRMLGLPVVDVEGAALGRLIDLHFDPQDGAVEFYEVASDEQGPALMLPPFKDLDVQADRLVMPKGAVQRQSHDPSLDVDLLEAEGFEEQVGEEDVEVQRLTGDQT